MLDGSVATLLTIHYNLCLGTIAMYLKTRLDLQPIVDKLLSFESKWVTPLYFDILLRWLYVAANIVSPNLGMA